VFVCHVPVAPLVDDSGWLQRAMGVVHGVHAEFEFRQLPYRPTVNQSINQFKRPLKRHTILTVEIRQRLIAVNQSELTLCTVVARSRCPAGRRRS